MALVVPLVTALSLVVRQPRPHDAAVDRAPGERGGAAVARHGSDLRGDGRVQLVRPPRQPPSPDAVALPRAAPLPGGHERADRLPDPSAHPRVVPGCAGPGDRAPGQRRARPRRCSSSTEPLVAFAHSNTNLGFGPLERIFVSPNFHRIHHQLDGPQDVNLGFALTIWDQLFHRAVFPTAATIRTDTGLPGRPLAVEQSGDAPAPPRRVRRAARRPVPPDRTGTSAPRATNDVRQATGRSDVAPWHRRCSSSPVARAWLALVMRHPPGRPVRRRGPPRRADRAGVDLHLLRGAASCSVVRRPRHPRDLAVHGRHRPSSVRAGSSPSSAA